VDVAALAAGVEGAMNLKKRQGNRRFLGVGQATGDADSFPLPSPLSPMAIPEEVHCYWLSILLSA
jgi:hypothetical protein